MGLKVVLAFCMIMCLWVSVGVSQSPEADLNAFIGQVASGGDQKNSCANKLLPCQQYIDGTTPPPANCCEPLKEIIKDQVQCLCDSLHNPMIMQTLNVTKEAALKLPKACGADFDESTCKTAAPSNDSASSDTPADDTPESDSKSSAANGISYSYLATNSIVLLALVVSVF